MNIKDTASTTIIIRAKAFPTENTREYLALVETDGSVLVWDSAAGCFTRAHSLCAIARKRARKLAAEA